MSQGGINLLATAASNAEDPQTLRMIAGAIANLCGNGNLSSVFYFTIIITTLLFCIFGLANGRNFLCVHY